MDCAFDADCEVRLYDDDVDLDDVDFSTLQFAASRRFGA